MSPTDRELLESILTAQILLLSEQLHVKAKANGSNRIGGDYTSEAIQLIKSKRQSLLMRLLEP